MSAKIANYSENRCCYHILFEEKWRLREFYWMFSWVVGDAVLGVRCLMLGVDEVLLWVFGDDVLGVKC